MSGSPRLPPRPSAAPIPSGSCGAARGCGDTRVDTHTRTRYISVIRAQLRPHGCRVPSGRAKGVIPRVRTPPLLCLRLQRGCGVRGWGRDGLGTGRRGEGAEGVDVGFALDLPSPAIPRYQGVRTASFGCWRRPVMARATSTESMRMIEAAGPRSARRESHGGDAAHQTAAADVSVACGQPGQVVCVDAVEEVSENRQCSCSPPLVGQLGVSVFGHVARPRCSPALICRTLSPPLDLRRLGRRERLHGFVHARHDPGLDGVRLTLRPLVSPRIAPRLEALTRGELEWH